MLPSANRAIVAIDAGAVRAATPPRAAHPAAVVRYARSVGTDVPPSLCHACRGELFPGSRFCGRCGAPQPPAPHTMAPPARGGRTWLVAIVVIAVVAGGAVAGVLVARRGGGHVSMLSCPAGLCPRFPIDRRARVEAIDPVFGRVRLEIPPAAMRAPTELTIRPAPAGARPPRVTTAQGEIEPTVIGPVIELGPDGETFARPLRLELPFEPGKVPAGAGVGAVTWGASGAERLTPIAVDDDDGVMIVEVTHFSRVVAVIDPGAATTTTTTQTPPTTPPPTTPPPCPTPTLRQEKCPWTPDGYSVGECTPGFCWDGGPQGFLACKQKDIPPGVSRGENMNPHCATGVPVYDRCTGLLTACAPMPPSP